MEEAPNTKGGSDVRGRLKSRLRLAANLRHSKSKTRPDVYLSFVLGSPGDRVRERQHGQRGRKRNVRKYQQKCTYVGIYIYICMYRYIYRYSI